MISASALVGCSFASDGDHQRHLDSIGKLEELLPLVESLGVVSWEDSGSCASIDYDRGSFQEDTEDGLECFVSDKPPARFDALATANHAEIGRRVTDLGLGGLRFGFVTYRDGKAKSGNFFLAECEALILDADGSVEDDVESDLERVTDRWLLLGSGDFPCSEPP